MTICLAIAATLLAACSPPESSDPTPRVRPNILLILADDLGYGGDSVDLWPVLRGDADAPPPRRSLIHHSARGMFALRFDEVDDGGTLRRWKLIEGLGSGGFTEPRQLAPPPGGAAGQLYELTADPAETSDLYLDRPDIVERLTAELEAIRGADAAPLPPPEPVTAGLPSERPMTGSRTGTLMAR